MKQYQYTIVEFPFLDLPYMPEFLNEMGSQGWQLLRITFLEPHPIAFEKAERDARGVQKTTKIKRKPGQMIMMREVEEGQKEADLMVTLEVPDGWYSSQYRGAPPPPSQADPYNAHQALQQLAAQREANSKIRGF